MNTEGFEFISALLKKRSGLVLTRDKMYLLESRLTPVARQFGVGGLDALIDAIRQRQDAKMIDAVVEAMTTNESFFFRDIKPFDQFRDFVLPELIKSRATTKHIRVWCAACSSGQEPYSLCMILKERAAQLAGWRIEIVATDISREMLTKARRGVYSQFEVQRGLPIGNLVKYFTQEGDKWTISAELRNMVQYREFNLLESPRGLGMFDVVFCRNVLIYFDQATKGKVLEGIGGVMRPDAFLYLGGAETVLGVTDRFAPISGMRGIYGHVNRDSGGSMRAAG
ncbi:MAG: protein-glutamate O-methyltransferase [Alphaproteobacteria bacterium]